MPKQDSEKKVLDNLVFTNSTNPQNGLHAIIDLTGCELQKIESIDFWNQTVSHAIKNTSVHILGEEYHKFEPQGLSGIILLSASHISFHTWPEYKGYVSLDVFSCSDRTETEDIISSIVQSIPHTHKDIQKLERGFIID